MIGSDIFGVHNWGFFKIFLDFVYSQTSQSKAVLCRFRHHGPRRHHLSRRKFMSKSPLSRVLLDQSDLWVGATSDDAIRIVMALKSLDLPVSRTDQTGRSNVTEILQFSDLFREVVLSEVKEAIERAEAADAQHVARELTRRRAELERAIAERDRWQAEIEAASASLEALENAATAFRKAAAEALR